MVTSWLSMEVPMFPSKAVPLRCHWSLDEALIRRDGPKCLCMRVGRTVPSNGRRNTSLHQPDHQGSALCSMDPSGGAWTSRVCWGFVVRTRSRYTSRLDRATPNRVFVEDLIPMAGRRSLAHSNVGTLRKRGWRLAPNRCAVELRGSLRPETLAGLNWQFSGDHVVKPGTRI